MNDSENDTMVVEFLVAWEDGTWDTHSESIPDDLFRHGDPGDSEFDSAVLNWAHGPGGLASQARYRKAVKFAIYHYDI